MSPNNTNLLKNPQATIPESYTSSKLETSNLILDGFDRAGAQLAECANAQPLLLDNKEYLYEGKRPNVTSTTDNVRDSQENTAVQTSQASFKEAAGTTSINWKNFFYNATVGAVNDLISTAIENPYKTAFAAAVGVTLPLGLVALGISTATVSTGLLALSGVYSFLQTVGVLERYTQFLQHKISAKEFEKTGQDLGFAVLSAAPLLGNRVLPQLLGRISSTLSKVSEPLAEKVMKFALRPETHQRLDNLIEKLTPKLYAFASDAQMGSYTNNPHRIMNNADKIDRIQAIAARIYKTTYSPNAKDFLQRARSVRQEVSRLPWETY